MTALTPTAPPRTFWGEFLAILRWHFPTPREVLMSLPDPRVMIAAIVGAVIVILGVVTSITLVALNNGQAGAFAIAIGGALTGLGSLAASILNRRNGNGGQ